MVTTRKVALALAALTLSLAGAPAAMAQGYPQPISVEIEVDPRIPDITVDVQVDRLQPQLVYTTNITSDRYSPKLIYNCKYLVWKHSGVSDGHVFRGGNELYVSTYSGPELIGYCID